jgi:uncharacterized protein YndB with AHSA1/START domain
VATAEIEVNASPAEVWNALTDPEQIKEYMFGSQVVTDWKQGSPIVWKGEYEGKEYEDKGEILEIEPERRLKMTHFSPSAARRIGPRTTTRSSTSSMSVADDARLAQSGQQPHRGGR